MCKSFSFVLVDFPVVVQIAFCGHHDDTVLYKGLHLFNKAADFLGFSEGGRVSDRVQNDKQVSKHCALLELALMVLWIKTKNT